MKAAPLVVVDILREVVQATDAVLYPTLNKHILYEHGRSIQILQALQRLNDGITTKNTKYPLFAVFQPFWEKFSQQGYYCSVTFPKISIATLTQSTDPTPKRYDQTFRPILYPIWSEFVRQLTLHPNIVIPGDPGAIEQMKADVPGVDPTSDQVKGTSMNDYVDAIAIANLQLGFKQVNNCRTL